MSRFIPLSIPNFEGNEEAYAVKAVKEGWVSTAGAYISELEGKLEDYLEMPSVVACQSGTAGIHLALLECGLTPSDHVIVPTLTFIAAVNPVKYLYGNPIFMDCDDSLCMDPEKLKEFIENECEFKDGILNYKTTNKPIKAILVVHVFGNLADMEKIMMLAKEYNFKIVEDATEALGTYYRSGIYKGKKAGTIGDFGVFSFNGNKIITTGGGGAITGQAVSALEHIKYLSTQAKDDEHYYVHHEIGYNYRMTNVQAAIGVAQLEQLEEFIKRKNDNYKLYKELFSGSDYYNMIGFRESTYSNKWFYSLNIEIDKINMNIREIIEALQDKGIQTRPIWGLIHEQIPYQKDTSYRIENATYYSQRILNIPCSTNIKEEEIRYVAAEIIKLLESCKKTIH
ncbi:MAG: LegC family aminotransferase [Clostridiales bacterium]|nr:LegC family aminotransferase [Clostridiales bacterium]